MSPWSPSCEQHQISPCNINAQSAKEIVGVMIPPDEFSSYVKHECVGTEKEIWRLNIQALKQFIFLTVASFLKQKLRE